MSAKSITYNEYRFLMNRVAYWLISNNKKIKMRSVYRKGYTLKEVKEIIKKNKDSKTNTWGRWFMDCAVIDNKSYELFPSYVTGSDGVKYYLNTYIDMNKRVLAYVKAHDNTPPKIVNIQGSNNNNTTSNTTDSTLQKVYNAIGKFSSIDGFLEIIQGRGYGYYYNNVYNTDQTISRLKNRQPLNCTDITQLMYRIAIALGYKDVQIIHVMCKGGDGHVRIRMRDKKTGEFFYRDGASVLDGESITSNWCMNGNIIGYNPQWIFDSMYQ